MTESSTKPDERASKREGRRHGGRGVLVAVTLALVAFAAGVSLQAFGLLPQLPSVVSEKTTVSVTQVEEIVKPASDLVTMRYYYTDASTIDESKVAFNQAIPFTRDRSVFTYSGIVSVGIDLSQVKYQIDNEARVITIQLPELAVLSNEIDHDSFDILFTEDSVFNDTNLSDMASQIDALKAQAAERVLANEEFMGQALHNTEEVLRGFLTSADATSGYTVVFGDVSSSAAADAGDSGADSQATGHATESRSGNAAANDAEGTSESSGAPQGKQ